MSGFDVVRKVAEKPIAWLEKQGWKKPFEYENPNIQQNDFAPKSALEAIKEEKNDNANKIEQSPADKVESFDKYEGLTDFEWTLADICIGWIGEELGWKQYIKDNADILLKIAIKKFNSVQDAPFEQSPAWSEEDEAILGDIICSVNASDAFSGTIPLSLAKHEKKISWLKSLKDRYVWKPSDEQIEILEMVLTNESMDDNIARILRELREQLKKLKG